MASSRQQPGAVNRPFNTATHLSATLIRSALLRPVRPTAVTGSRPVLKEAQGAPGLRSDLRSLLYLAMRTNTISFGLSMITTPTLAGRPTGGYNGVTNTRSSSRVHGPWHPSPAQAFGLVASGSTAGQYGTPADNGGLATSGPVAPVLSPRRSPCPRGRGCLCPFPRAAGRSFQTPFVTPPARNVWPSAPHTSC